MSFAILTKLTQSLRYNTQKLLIKPPSTVCSFHSNVRNTAQLNITTKKTQETGILDKVNETQLLSPSRTFAVVQIGGKQFKVTADDVIIIEGYWPPDVGDKLRLDKVLCAGSENFSLIGTPLIQSGLVNVYATVIEKNLSHTKTHFRKKRRKQYTNINFYRMERTMLRINEVGIGEVKDE